MHSRFNCLIMIALMGTACFGQGGVLPPAGPTNPQPGLTANAKQVAVIIGVEPLLQRLQTLNSAEEESRIEELLVRQEIYNAALAASLDVDSVVAEIDNERAQITEVRNQLETRRDKAVNTTGVANIIIGTGLGIVGTAMQLSDRTAQAGNIVGVSAGSVSTALQFYSLRQQSGGRVTIGRVPNMLAPLFDRPPALYAAYPPDLWAYLNATPEALPSSRLQQLISEWISAGRIDEPGSPSAAEKVALLTTGMDTKRKVSIDLLTDRTAMLDDVRGRVLLMKRDLADLLRSLPRAH